MLAGWLPHHLQARHTDIEPPATVPSTVGIRPPPQTQENETVPSTATPTLPDFFLDDFSYDTETLPSIPEATTVVPATECNCLLSVVGRCPTQA